MSKLSVKFIRENVTGADSVSSKGGIFTVRRGFFYTHGHTAEAFAAYVKTELESSKLAIQVVETGTVWKPFRGGASVANQSHWWVRLCVVEVPK